MWPDVLCPLQSDKQEMQESFKFERWYVEVSDGRVAIFVKLPASLTRHVSIGFDCKDSISYEKKDWESK